MTRRPEETTATAAHGVASAKPRRSVELVVSMLVALSAVAVGAWALVSGTPTGSDYVGASLVVCWAVAGTVVSLRQPGRLGLLISLVALVAAGIVAAFAGDDANTEVLLSAILVGVLGHLGVALPDGVLGSTRTRLLAGGCYLSAAAGAVAGLAADSVATPAFVGAAALAAVLALLGYTSRCRVASAIDRARLQWMGWGVVVAAAIALTTAVLELLLSWPGSPGAVALAGTAVVPVAFVISTFPKAVGAIDRVLVHTIILVGLIGLVGATYVLVVIGLGRAPVGDERSVLLLSMLAAAVAAMLVFPARRRIEQWANQRVYGEQHSPEEALRTFGGRMSRAVPMDELLLQLAETLKKTMNLRSAEVWTGADGLLERTVSVPDRPLVHLHLEGEEVHVAARAHVQGNAWIQVWMPALLDGRGGQQVRVAAVAHLGELLGLIVAVRNTDDAGFTEDDDRVLTELARQVGLALHNVRLDSALQASLDELQERNVELQASRLRIVTAADESRRRIERNLHDGAQQHLVALAVKVGLVKQLLDADPDTAQTMLDELREDVQVTLTELRNLAHGIYPPLLRDRGLAEALRTAANRAVLATDVDAEAVGRYPSEVEAAVYFCCLEAMQNAGKRAGAGAQIVVTVRSTPDLLTFEVADDGPGFDPTSVAEGHGFVNIRDRLGAVGGVLALDSAPGQGSHIRGSVPVASLDPPDRAP